jgi:hypothetical protein
MANYEKSSESLLKYTAMKEEFEKRHEPVPAHITRSISMFTSLNEKHFMELQCELVQDNPASPPLTAPPQEPPSFRLPSLASPFGFPTQPHHEPNDDTPLNCDI